MRSNLNRLVFLIFALLFAGCGGGGPSSSAVPAVESVQTGSVAFRLGQPSRILAQIVSVEVEVLNPNTEQAVLPAQQLVFGQEVIFSHVPVGVHLVRATGYASDGSIESRDQVEVLVVAGQTTRAQLILNNPSPEPTETPTPETNSVLYVTSVGTTNQLIAVDASTYQPLTNSPVTLDFAPEEIAVDVSGERVFVVGQSNNIAVFNALTLAPVGTIPIGGDAPYGVAYDPDRDRVYVGDSTGTLFAFNATTGAAAGSQAIGGGAYEVLYFEDRIYVAGRFNAELDVLDADSPTLDHVAGSPFGATGPVSGSLETQFLGLDATGRRVIVGLPPISVDDSYAAVFEIDSLAFITNSPFDFGGDSGVAVTGVDYDTTQQRVLGSVGSSFHLLQNPTFGPASGSPVGAGFPLYDVLFDAGQNRIIGSNASGASIQVLDGATLTPITGSPFTLAGIESSLRNMELVTFP